MDWRIGCWIMWSWKPSNSLADHWTFVGEKTHFASVVSFGNHVLANDLDYKSPLMRKRGREIDGIRERVREKRDKNERERAKVEVIILLNDGSTRVEFL